MKRRSFLRAAGAGVAVAATWPSWLQSAFAEADAEVPADVTDHVGAMAEAFRRAQRAGKPLLVMVIPVENRAKWQRGMAFGELLNHGGEASLQDLALVELVCAPLAAVRALVPQTPALPADPLMVLVETAQIPAHVQVLDAPLATDPEPFRGGDDEGPIDARIATLSGLIHRALLPNAQMLERRAAQARQSLGAATIADIDRALAAGSLTPALADRATAHILAAELGRRKPVAAWRRAIVAGASARIQRRRIPGSHWASSAGCGTQIEDWSRDDNRMIGCGMAHIPPRSQRFLHFFAPGSD